MPVKWDNSWKKLGIGLVAGVDEAGRGCLAGPVYAAAVIMNDSVQDKMLKDYRDSKQLSELRREELVESILSHHHVGVGFATEVEIDSINIRQASFLAMRRAVAELKVLPEWVVVDGQDLIPEIKCQQKAYIGGDARIRPIAMASIVAKVMRDRFVRMLDQTYPVYGFAQHKGYATAEHRLNIETHGPCAVHRRSFAGVKEFWRDDLRS